VRSLCGATSLGTPEAFPAPRARPAPRQVSAFAGALRRGGRCLLVRRPSRGLLGGLWELPSGGSIDELLEELAQRTGLRAAAGPNLGQVRHVFTHRTLTLRVIELKPRDARRPRAHARAAGVRWCSPRQIARLPLSRLMHKAMRLVERTGPAYDPAP
jgi:A/G-specific adenine glycosylase